jgi:beta-mannosidase
MKTDQFLHQNWKFRSEKSRSWLSARVPGCVHTDLLRHKRIPDPFWGSNELQLQWIEKENWIYRAEFTPGRDVLAAAHVDLVADGLDTDIEVRLNDKLIGKQSNMFVRFRGDVGKCLRAGRNVLEIRFISPMDYIKRHLKPDHFYEWCDAVGGASLIRKEQCSFGWDWAPRFATSGIYLPIYLQAWDEARIESVQVSQQHRKGIVELDFVPEIVGEVGGEFHGAVYLGEKKVADVADLKAVIRNPELWWPNGHGAQPLYRVELEYLVGGRVVDRWSKRIGLRTVELDRHTDEFGESFQFIVNGKPIFAKGANWIPSHSFVSGITHTFYDDLLSSAAEANMNMLRIWGGGIYEKEEFYDLCDEKGLLLWHDFMFACALYSGDEEFLGNVRTEAAYQVKRLAHRPSLALWCGNNELEQMPQEILKTPGRKKAYEDVFYKILPEAVAQYDGATPYWPCSPHNPEGYEKGHNNERAGDCHFWDVWHSRKPVKRYEEMKFRFCSEFGMQSYSSPEVAATYCRPENFNVFGPEMENHQKNGSGNLIILDYVSRLYRFPKDYAALSYLSQLNQAYCMKVGVEHFRRSMPRTMGALYWQLNDCWPVASWSSIEFGGTWKALQYEAKRFFEPAMVSIHIPGDENPGKNNTLVSTIHEAHVYTVFDGVREGRGRLTWELFHLEKGKLKGGAKTVALRYGKVVREFSLDFASEIAKYGASTLYLRATLSVGGKEVSRRTAFLTAPRYLQLRKSKVDVKIRKVESGRYVLQFKSGIFQHAVAFHLKGIAYRAQDNFFDLYPKESHVVEVTLKKGDVPLARLKKALQVTSLVDSF